MKLLRIEASLNQRSDHEHCVQVRLPPPQVQQLIFNLVASLNQPRPADGEVYLNIPFFGTLTQHVEEWRPLGEMPATQPATQPASECDTCEREDDD